MTNRILHLPGAVAAALALAFLGACGQVESERVAVPAGKGALELAGRHGFGRSISGVVRPSDRAQEELFVSGWHLRETYTSGEETVWSVVARPVLLLPLAEVPTVDVELSLEVQRAEFRGGDYPLGVEVNGVELGTTELVDGMNHLRLPVPSGLLFAGLNRIVLQSPEPDSPADHGFGGDRRKLGFRLGPVVVNAADAKRVPVLHRSLKAMPGATVHWSLAEGAGPWSLVVQDGATGVVQSSHSMVGAGGLVELSEDGGEDLQLAVWPVDPGDSPGLRSEDELTEFVIRSEPNYTDVILIVVDTLRADALVLAAPPNIAGLAAESTVFEYAFAHAPITLPSHTALFSSRHPHVTGIVNNGQTVSAELPLFAPHLASFGYRTLAAVSLGTLLAPVMGLDTGLDRGFDRFESASDLDSYAEMTAPLLADLLADEDGSEPMLLFAHFADPHEPYRSAGPTGLETHVLVDGVPSMVLDPGRAPYVERRIKLEAGPHQLAFESPGLEVQLRSLALRFEDGTQLEPRFLEGALMALGERHVVEFDVPADGTVEVDLWLNDYPRKEARYARYAEEIAMVDVAIGELIADLKTAGRWDDSLVVFTSDHGEGLAQHGIIGHVGGLFEEQLHVPLLVKLPAGEAWQPVRSQLEQMSKRVVRHVDLVPTLLELLGLPPLAGQEGRSLLDPDLADGTSLEVLGQTHAPEARFDLYSLRDERWKLIYAPDSRRFQMFDIQADPAEEQDVFAEHGDERIEWQVRLRDLALLWKRDGNIETDEERAALRAALGY
ncbi:MAG: sulfatase-like hydrolase/transferase [Planctomycetota bacterium]|nr:sulfatase-like hydrolase/transferase [Planctomycetota bacterium]